MKLCTRCILPENFPGIRFDEAGVCQFCQRAPSPEALAQQQARLRDQFNQLVERVREREGHHCVMSWSGGKDSTYTLWLLKEKYGLRPLAFTLDNGFTSSAALKNMRVVSDNLGVDHILIKPRFDLLKQIFVAFTKPGIYPPRALERASAICNACMSLAKGMSLRLALERNIPIMAHGWSPGQIPLASAVHQTNPQMLRATLHTMRKPLEAVVGDQIAPYFPEEYHLEKAQEFPYNVSPLAFLEYNEEEAVRRIQVLGWERPQDTDPNSTNCLLNSFANLVHVKQMGYHPYAMELAGLVRNGYMTREEALGRLKIAASPAVTAAVQAKLGLSPSPPEEWAP